MPRQSPARRTYTKILGSLRKNELLQLAAEFGLSTDGSVIVLRDRVKTHLTSNNETLYRNPRYKALYPKVRQIPSKPRRLPSLRFSSSIPTPAASPTLSYRDPSPARSYGSWHGIDDRQLPSRSFSPRRWSPEVDLPRPLSPPPPSMAPSIPPPPPSDTGPIHGFPLLDYYRPEGCKFDPFVLFVYYSYMNYAFILINRYAPS